MTRGVLYPRCRWQAALQSIQVDAPNAAIAARLTAHHIDSRPTPPPAGTSFGLVVTTPPPHDPNVPHHDLDHQAGMRHLDIEYRPAGTRRALTARCGRNNQPRQPGAPR